MEGARPPKYPSFVKKRHYYFRKTAGRAPFGCIRHESSAEITDDSTFWRGDRMVDELGAVVRAWRPSLPVWCEGAKLKHRERAGSGYSDDFFHQLPALDIDRAQN